MFDRLCVCFSQTTIDGDHILTFTFGGSEPKFPRVLCYSIDHERLGSVWFQIPIVIGIDIPGIVSTRQRLCIEILPSNLLPFRLPIPNTLLLNPHSHNILQESDVLVYGNFVREPALESRLGYDRLVRLYAKQRPGSTGDIEKILARFSRYSRNRRCRIMATDGYNNYRIGCMKLLSHSWMERADYCTAIHQSPEHRSGEAHTFYGLPIPILCIRIVQLRSAGMCYFIHHATG